MAKIEFARLKTFKNISVIHTSGEGGIRTPGGLASSTVFKTAAFNHSATSPAMFGCKIGL